MHVPDKFLTLTTLHSTRAASTLTWGVGVLSNVFCQVLSRPNEGVRRDGLKTDHTHVRNNHQYAFTSLCKVWWILWMLARVVKWEFSWKSGEKKKQTSKVGGMGHSHQDRKKCMRLSLARVRSDQKRWHHGANNRQSCYFVPGCTTRC